MILLVLLRCPAFICWLGEIPPEALTGEPFDVIVTIDPEQFSSHKQSDYFATDTEISNPNELIAGSKKLLPNN